MKHEHPSGQHMKTSQGLRPTLVIAGQTTKARHPGERALHHPSVGQQDKAAFGLGQANHLQAYILGFGCLGRIFTRVALIDKDQFDVLSSHFPHHCGQLAHLITILFVGWRHVQGQQMNTSRKLCSRWGASSVIKVRYGATNAHSSSLTSLG